MIEALSSYQQRNNQQLDQWLNRIPFQTLPL
ncbi:geranyl transferase, partial [Vibrio cholerae]